MRNVSIILLLFVTLGGLFVPAVWYGAFLIGVFVLLWKRTTRPAANVAFVIPLAAIPIVGLVATYASRGVLMSQARQAQTECIQALGKAFSAEEAYFAKTGSYDAHPATVSFTPERGNRYLYAFSGDGPIRPNTGSISDDAVGIGADIAVDATVMNEALRGAAEAHGASTAGDSITIVCAANLDDDSTLDVWSISSMDRPGVIRGNLMHDVDDTWQ
jgi:hypothetical protein